MISLIVIIEGFGYLLILAGPWAILGALLFNNQPITACMLFLIGIAAMIFVLVFYNWTRPAISIKARCDLYAIRREMRRPQPDIEKIFILLSGPGYTKKMGQQKTGQDSETAVCCTTEDSDFPGLALD